MRFDLSLMENSKFPMEVEILDGVAYSFTCNDTKPKIKYALLINYFPLNKVIMSSKGHTWVFGKFSHYDENILKQSSPNEHVIFECSCVGRKLNLEDLNEIAKYRYGLCSPYLLEVKEDIETSDLLV